jgi:hypothetical protein
MSRYGYGHRGGYGGAEGAVGGLIAIVLILVFVAVVVLTVATCFMVKCFVKHGNKSKALWWSFVIALVLAAIGGALYLYNPAYTTDAEGVGAVAYLQLLVCTCVIHRKYSQTLMKERLNVVQEITSYAWWRNHDKANAV